MSMPEWKPMMRRQGQGYDGPSSKTKTSIQLYLHHSSGENKDQAHQAPMTGQRMILYAEYLCQRQTTNLVISTILVIKILFLYSLKNEACSISVKA
jgi:hypothetical protein